VIYGDGGQTRDFTYVANVVDANLRALVARGLRGQSVNVATGTRISLKTLLKTLAAMTDRPNRAEYRPVRAGDVRHSLASIRLARRLLGYVPKVPFEAGLVKTLAWYRSAEA
jgi:nucleoside-diphosphate-sugar epimerase